MTLSVPDICDNFIDKIAVLAPLFTDFGGKDKKFTNVISP